MTWQQLHQPEKRLCMFEIFPRFATIFVLPAKKKKEKKKACFTRLLLLATHIDKQVAVFDSGQFGCGLASRGLYERLINIMSECDLDLQGSNGCVHPSGAVPANVVACTKS